MRVYHQDKRESSVNTLVAYISVNTFVAYISVNTLVAYISVNTFVAYKNTVEPPSYRAISAAISLVNCTNSATESCSGRFVKSGCARNSA